MRVRGIDSVPVGDVVIEVYRGFKIKRSPTNAVYVGGFSSARDRRYFNDWTEARAVEKAKVAIDKEIARHGTSTS